MTPWTWPAGLSIDLFHWSWAAGRPDRLIHGWSLAGEVDQAGAVRLEAERGKFANRYQVDQAGFPTTQRHTFASAAELPLELQDDDGQPISWLRRLIDTRPAPRPNLN